MNALEENKFACCNLFDFAKAFDTVNHDILIRELENVGIRGIPLEWSKSHLNERIQLIKTNEVKLIYIHDIYRVSELLKFHLYAISQKKN